MSGFVKGWTLAAAIADRRDDADKLRAFARAADGGVGDALPPESPHAISYEDVAAGRVEADAGTWACKDGVRLIAARTNISDPVWTDRTALVDPHYSMFVGGIELGLMAEEDELKVQYWDPMRVQIDREQTVTLPDDFPGKAEGGHPVLVRAGCYDKQGTEDFDGGWSGPFVVIIRLEGTGPVRIAPAALLGVGTPAGEAGQPEGARRLRAADLWADFAAAPAVVSERFRGQNWISDGQINYVSAQLMGGAYALERYPVTLVEASRVSRDPRRKADYDYGSTLPGLRLKERILILESQLGLGVEHHESVHLQSRDEFRAEFGFWFNEGVTEYFTRLVTPTARAPLTRTESPYDKQLAAVKVLLRAGACTEAQLAGAYFGGDIAPLYLGFDEQLGAGGSLRAMADYLGPATASLAAGYLRQVAGLPDEEDGAGDPAAQ